MRVASRATVWGLIKFQGVSVLRRFETGFFEVRIKCLRFLRLAERVGVQGQSLQELWRCVGSSLHLRPFRSHLVLFIYKGVVQFGALQGDPSLENYPYVEGVGCRLWSSWWPERTEGSVQISY